MLTSGIILAKMNHQLFTQTYINILTPFTNLVHCPQIHLPISKVVDKILAAVNCYYFPLNLIDHKLRNHQAITKTNFLAQFSPNNFYFSFTGPKKNIGIIRLKDTQPPFCDYIIHGCSLGVY